MKRVCLVEGCYSTTRTEGIKLFTFPNNKERCLKWIEFSGSMKLKDFLEKRGTIPKSSKICSLHFCNKDYYNELKTRLLPGVVPSQNGPPEEFVTISETPTPSPPPSPSTSSSSYSLEVSPVTKSVFDSSVCDVAASVDLDDLPTPESGTTTPDSSCRYEAPPSPHVDMIAKTDYPPPSGSVIKRVCLVEGCYSTTRTKGVRLFNFPSNKEICLKWIEFSGSMKLMDFWERLGTIPRTSSKVCSLHFCDKDYYNELKTRLLPGVVPSQNGPSIGS